MRRSTEAIPELETAVRLAPNNPAYHFLLAMAYRRSCQLEELSNELKAALALQPDNAYCLFFLGYLLLRKGQFVDATITLNRAAVLKPDNAGIYCLLGYASKKRGDAEQAADQFSRALQLDPQEPVGHYFLGTTLMQLGRTDEAIRAFKTAVKLDPANRVYHYVLGCALLDKRLVKEAELEFASAGVTTGLPRSREATVPPAPTVPQSALVRSHLEFVKSILGKYNWSSSRLTQISASMTKIAEREADHSLYLGIVGEFSSGKSTLINAFLRDEILKTDVIQATTAISTLIRFGSQIDVVVRYPNGRQTSFKKDGAIISQDGVHFRDLSCPQDKAGLISYLQIVTATEEISKYLTEVTLYHPSTFLSQGIVIVDTPGIDVINKRHIDVTTQTVRERCDAAIVVIPFNHPMSLTLLEFLKAYACDILHRCIFTVTKLDVEPRTTERNRLLSFTEQKVRNSLKISAPHIFPVSPYVFLRAILQRKDPGFTGSSASDQQFCDQFLTAESAIVQILSGQKQAIQYERLSALMSLLYSEIGADLKKLDETCHARHSYLMTNAVCDLTTYTTYYKNGYDDLFRQNTGPSRAELIRYLRSVRDEVLGILKHNIINGAGDEATLREIIAESDNAVIKPAQKLVLGELNRFFSSVYDVRLKMIKQFEDNFYEIYKTLDKFDADAYRSYEEIKIDVEGKYGYRTDGSSGSLGASLGNELRPLTATVIGGNIVGMAGAARLRSLDELKNQYWQQVQSSVEAYFASAERCALSALDITLKATRDNIDMIIDRYFEHYQRQVRYLIEKDRAEVEHLEKYRVIIENDRALIEAHRQQLIELRKSLCAS